MIVKPDPVPAVFERPAPRGSSGASARTAESAFASVLCDVLSTKDPDGAGDDPCFPLDRDAVRQLILKISERMDGSLLLLAGAGSPFTRGVPWHGHGEPTRADPPSGGGVSKIRRLPPENDGGPRPDGLDGIIAEASRTYGVDRELIRSVIQVESGFAVRSTSPKGASGLMQLMPATARELGVTDCFDPVQNIMGGTRYLRKLLDRYHGDVRLALASYNWGMGNVEANPDRLPRETATYISRVLKHYGEAKA